MRKTSCVQSTYFVVVIIFVPFKPNSVKMVHFMKKLIPPNFQFLNCHQTFPVDQGINFYNTDQYWKFKVFEFLLEGITFSSQGKIQYTLIFQYIICSLQIKYIFDFSSYFYDSILLHFNTVISYYFSDICNSILVH